MRMRLQLIALSIILIVLVSLAGIGLWYRSYLLTPAPGQGEVVVVIPKGAGVRGIGALLAASGVLENDTRYLAMVYFSGLRAKLKAGEYSIPPGMTPPQVLELLASGRTRRYHVTIAEGLTAAQIAFVFERDGWVKPDTFLALVKDPAFIRQQGIEADSLEGYLFPETYTLVRTEADEAAVIRMMVARFQQVWQTLAMPKSLELNRHQLLTLASMVEKETGAAEERPLIARVFYNRLALKMRLQSDPTVIYGLADFNGNLTRADLRRETPYNTYLIPGLPPGPICNPGRAALEAVLYPVESDALYFVSKNDGTHFFSTNLADHNRAVQRYQRGQ
ncbi:MAG: endolytic transglycosylase MltG [Proteobacteria bacterium]|nr:endolytic transglycosylase MltG [Pseudomonadota bacterium]